ncbi:MAG: HEAT repeat domain-containing protein, partial [Planctomycetota bacterium]|nr:HEAT repeat domain-containing protein [Planctomycetota bacterium]
MGCQNDPSTEPATWSSKSNSVLASDLRNPELRHYQPVHGSTNLTVSRDAALEILLQAMDSENPLLRANAIEALHGNPRVLVPAVLQGLTDENRGVRFVAAMTVGKQQIFEVASHLEPLLNDHSDSVRAAAIYAMERCHKEVDLSPLANMLLGDNPEVRANVALIFGELGNPSAVPILILATRRPLSR